MANITEELQTISEGRYGKDVRKAIHDGIDKVNKDGGGGITLTSSSPLTNSTEANIVGIECEGKSTQGTSANMLTPSLNTSTLNGITCTKNADGTYTLNGTASGSAMFVLNATLLSLEPITYTFALTDNSSVKARVVQDTNGSRVELKNDAKQSTFTASSGSTYLFQINVPSGTTLSNVTVKPTVTTSTPTPTSPINIVDASGDVTCKTINLCEKIVSGLWDGTSISASSTRASSNKLIDVEGGKAYTVSFSSDKNAQAIIRQMDANNTQISQTSWITSGTSLTLESNTSKVALIFRISDNSANPENSISKVMLEQGTSATSYVAYASNKITLPYTLRSVGDVKDELVVLKDGSGKLIRRVAEVDLGSFTWVRTSNHFYAKASGFNAKKVGASAIMDALCASYPIVSTDTIGAETQTFALSLVYSSDYFFGLCDNRTTDATQIKSLLNGVKFVYALATPTTTTLTSSQVASILALKTYDGTTIVDSEMDVVVDYVGDTKGYIDTKTDYSYTDTIIGKWADGKDLHRRVEEGSLTDAASYRSFIADGVTVDIKDIRGSYILNNTYGDIHSVAHFVNNANGTKYGVYASSSNGSYTLIVEYTLNDESAISLTSEVTD